jgi:hypothetical protein
MEMRILTIFFLVAVLVLAGCSQAGSQAKHSGTEQTGPGQSGTRTGPEQTRTAPQGKPHSAQKQSQPTSQSIPGLNAAGIARIFEQQGLACKQPRGSGTLYDCTSEGNPNLSLLYVGQVTGSGPNQVRSVAAEVVMTAGGGDLASAAQVYFGVVARRMDYQGADASKATAFVYKNLSGTDSGSVTIGAAKWTLLSNAEAKVLEVASTK